MSEQRVNVVAWDDQEITLQLDKSMSRTISTRTEQYKTAQTVFNELIEQGKLKSFDLAGERSLTFSFYRSGQWDHIKSQLLRTFILGTGELEGEVSFYEIGADSPLERGKVIFNKNSGQRHYEATQPVAV